MGNEDRRLIGVIITGDAVATLARGGERIAEMASPVPATATFVHAYFCHTRNAFVVAFQDDSFAPVAAGCEIPLVRIPRVSVAH